MGSTRSNHLVGNTDNYFRYRHPYETEILQLKYPDPVYQKADPIPYLPFETTSAVFVDTEEGVLEMLKELKSATEIAVDLEHHDARSYVGLVSLMQISTRHKDWIVDTLKPWRQNLQVLNEIFADPKFIKVHQSLRPAVFLINLTN
jgi:exosome complex exonuclease RRP6